MGHFKSLEPSNGTSFVITYDDCTVDSIALSIDNAFVMGGYSVKSGNLGNRTYVKGNRVARLLLGAFYKYFEFNVVVAIDDDKQVKSAIRKTTSGMSGGVIGVNQVKKELTRLEGVLSQL